MSWCSRSYWPVVTIVAVSKTTSVREIDKALLPAVYILNQNYPHPFNPSTTIHYQRANSCYVQLKVIDVLGREVATLVNDYKPVGSYTVRLSENTTQLSSGVYYYILHAGNNIQSKKMMVIK